MNSQDENANKSDLSRRNILLAGTTLAAVSAVDWAIPVQTAQAQTQKQLAPSGQQPNHHNGAKVQCNLDVMGAPDFAFINVMKTARLWERVDKPTVWDITNTDANGYFKTLPAGINFIHTFMSLPSAAHKPGNWIARGRGRGRFGVGQNPMRYWDVPDVSPNITLLPNGQWEIVLGAWTDNQRSPPVGHFGGMIRIENIDANDHIRDLVILHEDDVEDFENGYILTKDFRDRVKEFGTLRWLNWLGSYGGNAGFLGKFRDTAPENYYSYRRYINPQRYCGMATTSENQHFTVGAPPDAVGLQSGEPEDKSLVTLRFPNPMMGGAGIVDGYCFIVDDIITGPQTHIKFRFIRPGAWWENYAPLPNTSPPLKPEWTVGARIWLEHNRYPDPLALRWGGYNAEGFEITHIDQTTNPNQPVITINCDTSGGKYNPTGGKWYISLVQTIKVGNSDRRPIGYFFKPGNEIGSVGYDYRQLNTMVYDKAFHCWLVAPFDEFDQFGRRGSIGTFGPPPGVLIKMCNEVGTNPWFNTMFPQADYWQNDYTQFDVDDFIASTDWVYQVAKLCHVGGTTHHGDVVPPLNEGIMAIFEGPNETWNGGQFPGWGTYYGWYRQSWREGQGNAQGNLDEWYGASIALTGRAVAKAYGYSNINEVRSQRKYRVVVGYQVMGGPVPARMRGASVMLKNWRPYRWVTDLAGAPYFQSPYQGSTFAATMGDTFVASSDPAERTALTDEWVVSFNNCQDWDANTEYEGPKPDGRTTTVWIPEGTHSWFRFANSGSYFFAKRTNIGKHPQTNPDDWAPQASPSSGPRTWQGYLRLFQAWGAFAAQSEWNPDGAFPLRMMMYEGGYEVWGHTTNVTTMANAASGTPALRNTTNLVHMLWFESYPGHADFPSEYLFASGLGWAVFRPDLYGAATGGFNSPRFLGTIDTNRGVTPPPIEPPEVGEPVIVNPIKTFNSEQIVRSDFAGSTAMAITAPTAGTALTVTKEALSGIGSSGTLGTVTFAAGSRAGQFGHYNVELSHMHSGDRVTLNLPTPGDATLRGIAWSLVTDTVTPHIEPPDQASPRPPVKVPQSVPSWCHGLNHPNLSACGSVHGRE